jgi:integrase
MEATSRISMRRIIMLVREESVEERIGRQAQATERAGRKPLRNTATGKCLRRADIFTDEELERFFNSKIYGDSELYLFYLCCLTAGLRPGEARGLRPKQILFDRAMLIVDGSIKKNRDRTAYNKKGHRDYWKFRIVPLSDLTLRLLKEHIERKGLNNDDFCFTAQKDPSRPVTEWHLRNHMAQVIKKAGIPQQGRKLALDSFRFTYTAHLWREAPAVAVMRLVGARTSG